MCCENRLMCLMCMKFGVMCVVIVYGFCIMMFGLCFCCFNIFTIFTRCSGG